jgi:hypothetical protein
MSHIVGKIGIRQLNKVTEQLFTGPFVPVPSMKGNEKVIDIAAGVNPKR